MCWLKTIRSPPSSRTPVIVPLPDDRLPVLGQAGSTTEKVVPATVIFGTSPHRQGRLRWQYWATSSRPTSARPTRSAKSCVLLKTMTLGALPTARWIRRRHRHHQHRAHSADLQTIGKRAAQAGEGSGAARRSSRPTWTLSSRQATILAGARRSTRPYAKAASTRIPLHTCI